MKALILAAGFGTRLEKSLSEYAGVHKKMLLGWIEGKPKGLVPIAGKSIISHQLDQLAEAGVSARNVYIQTNEVFYHQYLEWADNHGVPKENVFNNGVKNNEGRKEQVQDILLAIAKIGYDRPLFLFASDTLVYDQDNKLLDLSPMIGIYHQEGLSGVVAYYKENGVSSHGVITADINSKIVSFKEKPKDINSGLVNASVYLLSPQKLQQMRDCSEQLLGYKNPLELVWDQFKVVRAASRLDIGTIDDVLRANKLS